MRYVGTSLPTQSCLEFAKLEIEKCRSKQECHHSATEGGEMSTRIDGQGHQSTAVAGEQEKSSLHRGVALIKQLSAGRTARSRFASTA